MSINLVRTLTFESYAYAILPSNLEVGSLPTAYHALGECSYERLGSSPSQVLENVACERPPFR